MQSGNCAKQAEIRLHSVKSCQVSSVCRSERPGSNAAGRVFFFFFFFTSTFCVNVNHRRQAMKVPVLPEERKPNTPLLFHELTRERERNSLRREKKKKRKKNGNENNSGFGEQEEKKKKQKS